MVLLKIVYLYICTSFLMYICLCAFWSVCLSVWLAVSALLYTYQYLFACKCLDPCVSKKGGGGGGGGGRKSGYLKISLWHPQIPQLFGDGRYAASMKALSTFPLYPHKEAPPV